MDLVLLELILWVGLIFFLWALKDGLGGVELDIETASDGKERGQRMPPTPAFAQPENVLDPIGSYAEHPIYRYAVINGKRYCFDHVLPSGGASHQQEGERWIAPGLVYVECERQAT